MYNKLNEGLTFNALEDLVLPLITIDQYESKISDRRVIVTGFYVDDQDPADSLSSFIDRSSHLILDTEVSPNPAINGKYIVFVEIQRDENFPKILIDLLKDIKSLCKIDLSSWMFDAPDLSDPLPVTFENLKNNIILDQDDILELPSDIDELSDI